MAVWLLSSKAKARLPTQWLLQVCHCPLHSPAFPSTWKCSLLSPPFFTAGSKQFWTWAHTWQRAQTLAQSKGPAFGVTHYPCPLTPRQCSSHFGLGYMSWGQGAGSRADTLYLGTNVHVGGEGREEHGGSWVPDSSR